MKAAMTAVCAAALALAAGSADAHHSFAVFDRSRQVSITGTVKQFQWTNPHCWIQLEVPGENGASAEWSLEGGSPNILVRNGWKRTVLAPGERVTVLIYPLKTGEPGGSFLEVHKADGKVLYYHG